jgi:uncharacterized phage protein (TIGR01671 family)
MDREIKFRAWDRNRKIMLYPPPPIDSMIMAREGSPGGKHARIPNGTETRSFPAYMTWDGRCYIDGIYQDLKWLQFTGLWDANGKEIWEGDIVIAPGARQAMAVQYQAPSFIMRAKTASGGWSKAWSEFVLSPNQKQFQEVIGNVCEHPELLGHDT